MLAGKGFNKVYNLSGGIRAWNGQVAFGQEELGLALFSGNESPEETLVVAYSLEAGLHDFYLSMIPRVKNSDAKNLFGKLSEIEIRHQDTIFKEYLEITGKSVNRKEFEKTVIVEVVEGGLTSEEYANMFQPDWESTKDIVDIAMSIEAQALDLYLRVSNQSINPKSKKVLLQIASEERTHLALLGNLMEQNY